MGLLRGETLCEVKMSVKRANGFYCFLSYLDRVSTGSGSDLVSDQLS